MAGLITVGGLATGIDTNSIIDKLLSLEKRPAALLGVEVQDAQASATAINALAAGVTASAVNLGTASAPDFRLEIASKATGATSTVTVTHDDTALAVQTAQAGQNAQFTVDGFSGTFERESNTFGDVLPGVTVTLRNRGTATVTVADDADAITAKVKTLVAAFNDIVTFVTGESQVTETQDKSDVALGSLATDSTVKHLVARLHEVFSESVGGAYTNLSSLGLATQQDGTIAFDEGKFRTALGSDSTAVAATFAGAGTTSGVAKDLSALIDGMTGSGGTLALHTTALNDQIRSLQDQIDAGQREVDAFEVNLRQQFTALETFVSGLKNQGSFLQQAFGG